jgi:hypothetical protein
MRFAEQSRPRRRRRTGRVGLLGGAGKAEVAFSGEQKAGGIGGAGAGAGARSSGRGCSVDSVTLVGESLAFLAGRGEGEVGGSEDMLRDLWSSRRKRKAYIDPFFLFLNFGARI